MAARPVRTSALARNQVITSSASSAACVLDGSRLAARRARSKARPSVRDAVHRVRAHQAAAAVASFLDRKISTSDKQAAHVIDTVETTASHGARSSVLHEFSGSPCLLTARPTGASRRPPTALACSATRSDFCIHVSSARADEHLSERITLLYDIIRRSFNFVPDSPQHARHDGSDFR